MTRSPPTPLDGSIDISHQVVDCNLAGQFKYQVATSFSGSADCPSGDYVTYYQENFLGGQGESYCMAPVFDTGVCYGPDDTNDYAPLDCASPDVYFQVASEIEGTDTSTCVDPEPSNNFVLPEPAPGRVYCLA